MTSPRATGGTLSVVGNTLYFTAASTLPLTWQPGDGTWNISSNFWKDITAATTTYFDGTPGDSVVFDSTPGSGPYTVTLNDAFQPASVLVSNASYTISGTGGIGGSATTLTKAGTGTLTLSTSNSFGGGTAIKSGNVALAGGDQRIPAVGIVTLGDTGTSGKLILGDGASAVNQSLTNLAATGLGGSVVGGNASASGLTINNAVALTLGAELTLGGAGANENNLTFTKSGAGRLTLSSSNSYSGASSLTAGAIVATTNSALGDATGATTVASGSSLGLSSDVNYSTAEPLSIVGAGITTASYFFAGSAGSRGALQSVSGSNTFAGPIQISATGTTRIGIQNGAKLTLSGPITMGSGVTNVTMLFRAGDTDGDFITLTSSGNSWDTDTTIYTGNNIASEYAGVRLGVDDALPVSVGVSGAPPGNAAITLDLNNFNQTVAGLSSAYSFKIVNLASSGTSVLTLAPAADKSTAATLIQDGPSGGKVAVVVNGPAKQTFAGLNTYSGNTTINGGTLALASTGWINNSAQIRVAAGGTFDVTAKAGFLLGAAQTLSGDGNVIGATTVNGTVAPGSSIGTLTNTSATGLTFNAGATNRMEINVTNSVNADRLVQVGGTINLGGLLLVTNIGPNPTNGAVFDLYDGTLAGAFAATNLPYGLLHWNTAGLAPAGDGTITFTNNAPTARAVTNSVAQGGSTSITNNPGKNPIATDADADSLIFAVIAQPAGGTATATGSGVIYTNTAGTANVYDTLTYTVSDGFGGEATNTMAVWIQSAQGFNLVSQTNTMTHAYLTYAGIPSQAYVSERATNLTPPIVWTPLGTNTAQPTNGAFPGRVTFTNAFDGPVNFFRTQAQ
jgi:autotransporter-associated beta strand protein